MYYKKFSYNDVFHNTIVTNPEYEFFIHNDKIYLNHESGQDGDFGSPTKNKLKHIPQGYVSLHEINVNRPADSLVYPFITKDGARTAFKTVTTSQFQDSSQFQFGDVIRGSYPLSASVSRIFVKEGQEFDIHNFDGESNTNALPNKRYIRALKNSIDRNSALSSYFFYSSSYNDKGQEPVNLVCIPSIFYGSEVQKGSVELDIYLTGSLIAQLKDVNKNGELVETVGNKKGQIPGIILYDQGIIVLTGSGTTHTTQKQYFSPSSASVTSWLSYGTGIDEVGDSVGHSSFTDITYRLKFNGVNKIPTMTLLAHADPGEFNYSTNPTSIDIDDRPNTTINSSSYNEGTGSIKNINKSVYSSHDKQFENITYISKVGVYDENKNLIAIATLANPVKKEQLSSYTFKLRMDF